MEKQRRIEVYVATVQASIANEARSCWFAGSKRTVATKLKVPASLSCTKLCETGRAALSERRLRQHQGPRAQIVGPQTMHLQVAQAVEKALAHLTHKMVANPCA